MRSDYPKKSKMYKNPFLSILNANFARFTLIACGNISRCNQSKIRNRRAPSSYDFAKPIVRHTAQRWSGFSRYNDRYRTR